MNAVDGLWPEEETASAGAGTASTSADDPFAPAEEAAEPADAADSGAGFFFMPADAEPAAPGSRATADSPFLAEDDAFSSPALEPEVAPAADHLRSHNRLSIRPARPEPQRTPGRAKPRSVETAVGRLARAVEGLRELESEMGATLAAADRALRALGGRDVYECAGFASYAELEQRLVRAAPFLQALRVAIRRTGGTLAASGRAEQHPKRTTRALVTISRALHRLRELEDQVSQQALHARQALGDIETERLYEECGYTSFEDFLERALGPSPLLSCAVALVVEAPAEEVVPPPLPAETAAVAVGFEDTMMWSGPELEPEPAPPPSRSRLSVRAASAGEPPTSESPILAETRAPEPPPVEPSISPPPMRPHRLSHVVLTVALALVATGIGVASAHMGLLGMAQVGGPDASVLGQPAPAASSALAAAAGVASSSAAVAPARSPAPVGRSPRATRPATTLTIPPPASDPAKPAPNGAEPTSTTEATSDAITQALNQAIDAAKSPGAATAAKAALAPRKRPGVK
jgi:hypothetical protein